MHIHLFLLPRVTVSLCFPTAYANTKGADQMHLHATLPEVMLGKKREINQCCICQACVRINLRHKAHFKKYFYIVIKSQFLVSIFVSALFTFLKFNKFTWKCILYYVFREWSVCAFADLFARFKAEMCSCDAEITHFTFKHKPH